MGLHLPKARHSPPAHTSPHSSATAPASRPQREFSAVAGDLHPLTSLRSRLPPPPLPPSRQDATVALRIAVGACGLLIASLAVLFISTTASLLYVMYNYREEKGDLNVLTMGVRLRRLALRPPSPPLAPRPPPPPARVLSIPLPCLRHAPAAADASHRTQTTTTAEHRRCRLRRSTCRASTFSSHDTRSRGTSSNPPSRRAWHRVLLSLLSASTLLVEPPMSKIHAPTAAPRPPLRAPQAALNLEYPGRVEVYVLDDGADPDLRNALVRARGHSSGHRRGGQAVAPDI